MLAFEDVTTDGMGEPARSGFTVTPSDTNIFTVCPRALYIGSDGNVTVKMFEGMTLTFTNIPAGLLLPIRVQQVLKTGTTASGILGLY